MYGLKIGDVRDSIADVRDVIGDVRFWIADVRLCQTYPQPLWITLAASTMMLEIGDVRF